MISGASVLSVLPSVLSFWLFAFVLSCTKMMYSISCAEDILVVMPRMRLFLFSSTGMVKTELPAE